MNALRRDVARGFAGLRTRVARIEGRLPEDRIRDRIDAPVGAELPRGSGVRTGSYGPELADRWIAEYAERTREPALA